MGQPFCPVSMSCPRTLSSHLWTPLFHIALVALVDAGRDDPCPTALAHAPLGAPFRGRGLREQVWLQAGFKFPFSAYLGWDGLLRVANGQGQRDNTDQKIGMGRTASGSNLIK